MNKNNLKWEDSYYFNNIIFPLKNNLYPASPNPEQYGITITILEDYLKKKKAVDDKFYCGEDGFKGMAFKYCFYFGWIICVILGLVLGSVWSLFLGAGWKFRCKVTPYVRSHRDPLVRLKMTPWT